MFDFDVGKLLIFGIVALAVIPPKDLPRVMRTVGQTIGKMRRMAAEFQNQFMDAMKEAELESVKAELENVKKELSAIEESSKINASFDPAMAMRQEITSAVEGPRDVGLSEIALSEPGLAATEGVSVEPESLGPVAPPAAANAPHEIEAAREVEALGEVKPEGAREAASVARGAAE